MTGNNNNSGIFGTAHIDWWAVIIWLALVVMGWVNIYAAVYDESAGGIFDIHQRYGMQMVWIGVSLAVALTIMLLDDMYWHMFAYPLYAACIIMLVAVLFLGREVNGAKAWIYIGRVAVQPTEFVKFATSLAVARYMSRYNFSIHRFGELVRVAAIIALPVAIIFLQNDTGSALVYGAFLFMLYREGLSGWVYVALIMAVVLFFTSFLLEPAPILIGLIVVCVAGEGIVNGRWRSKIIYLSALALGSLVLYFGFNFLLNKPLSFFTSLLVCAAVSVIGVAVYAYRNKLRNVYAFLIFFVASLAFVSTVDYVFDNMLQPHQQDRVLHLLGLESDLKGAGYNVNQSMIAIGSGGFAGKGFMEGTQTRFNFVPEQSTDFIFCTVGEEWGFLGSAVVLGLFCLLILRLMQMGERQREPFGRIYCYSAAAIFFFHVVVNVGMTIGIVPVIGIPLPFFSYGGSSFLAFTILFFIAVRLDAGKRELMRH